MAMPSKTNESTMETFQSALKRVNKILAILTIALLVVGVVSIIATTESADTAHRATVLSTATHKLAANAERLARKIQTQRFTTCQDQNTRHRNTVKQLRVEFAFYSSKFPKDSPQQKQLAASFKQTKLLIDTLAPVRDCSKFKPPAKTKVQVH